MLKIKGGSKVWYVADGWMPLKHETKDSGYEGHEAIMVLNTGDKDAEILMDIYFDDKEPIKDIKLSAPPRRVKCFRMDHPDEIGGVKINRQYQYALRFRSNIEVVIQYGKLDVTQSNLAYLGILGYSE
jgi:hypothetical protein